MMLMYRGTSVVIALPMISRTQYIRWFVAGDTRLVQGTQQLTPCSTQRATVVTLCHNHPAVVMAS